MPDSFPEDEYLQILTKYGAGPDQDIDLAECAILMAALDNQTLSIDRYKNHIQKLIKDVGARHQDLLGEGATDDAATQLAALKHIIADENEYAGDEENYDDLQNVNLIRVIERRKGMPVALALIYIHVGLAQGWQVEALSFPAHVVCRMEKNGARLLFDPFQQCNLLQAADLRNMLKTLISPEAELSTDYYNAASKREVLIRLQNNIKLRQVESEDYEGAIKTIETMRLLDPNEYRLLFDAGVLYARTSQALAAITALESYIDLTPDKEAQYDALALLRQIKDDLH